MDSLRQLASRLVGLFRRRNLEAEMAEEMRQHLERRTQEKIADGLTPDEARYAAQREFGGIAQVQEQCRDERHFVWLEQTFRDVYFAVRSLRKNPGFTAVAVLTLALGIGACTTIFSIVNGVLLRPLAFRSPEQLVWLRERYVENGGNPVPVNGSHFLAWRERARLFTGFSLVDSGTITLTGIGQPELLRLVAASANLFDLLGSPLARGRGFAPEEETAGRNRVVVISDALWRRSFSADPAILGRSILLDGAPHTIIGVLPADFRLSQAKGQLAGLSSAANPDIFRPKVLGAEELRDLFGRHNYGTIARLKSGVGLAQAEAELNAIDAQFVAAAGQRATELRAVLMPLQEAIVGPARRGLIVLFAAVASVLLIACVNLMNFLLAQAEGRSQEAAVRQALGASRLHLLRQSLTVALLVALAGGALGLWLAYAGLGALLSYAPADIPRLAEVRIDPGVLLFSLGATLLTGLIFGLAPAWQLARSDPQQALTSGSRAVAGAGRRWHDALVAIEVGFSVLLLAAAALFAGSFMRLLRTDPGFRAPTVLTAEVLIPSSTYVEPAQRTAFFERALARLDATPGIESAATISLLPLQGETWIDKSSFAGDPRPAAEKPSVNIRFISSDYFITMGIPLRAGRSFAADDRRRRVTIISESLARIVWPGQDAVGRQLEREPGDEYEVIGVAGDVRPAANSAPVPMAYRPYWDWATRRAIVAVRTVGDPRAAAGALRGTIQAIDRDVPVPTLRTMDEILGESVAPQRFQLLLVGTFAGSALLLTAMGIYGVVAYSVGRRRKELGVRIALGAQAADVKRLVLAQGMRPVVVGLVAGLAVALVAGRVLESLLYDTSSSDPFALTATAAVLAVIALFSCYFPARRASKVDPMVALRCE
jgi:putative ABC transport system permease protein